MRVPRTRDQLEKIRKNIQIEEDIDTILEIKYHKWIKKIEKLIVMRLRKGKEILLSINHSSKSDDHRIIWRYYTTCCQKIRYRHNKRDYPIYRNIHIEDRYDLTKKIIEHIINKYQIQYKIEITNKKDVWSKQSDQIPSFCVTV